MIQKWWDDAQGGNITNPWLREDMGDDLEDKEDFIFRRVLPMIEDSPGVRGKIRLQWAAERDAAQGAQPPPPPSPSPTIDPLIGEALGLAGQSGQNYNQ